MSTKAISLFFIPVFLWSVAVAQETTLPTLEEGIRQLAIDIANQMKKRDIKKIAIDDFTDLNGYKSALGDFISEELVTNFYTQSLGSFDVVERRELARVLKEQKLGSTGLLNKKTIAKIGEILGIDAIVTGSISYLRNNIKINARMIGVESAKVFAAAARKIPKDETVEELMRQSARPSSSAGQPVASSSGIQVQRHDVYFQNSALNVMPKSVRISDDKKTISLALQFRNVLNENIYIGAEQGVNGIHVSMMSNNGEVLTLSGRNGLFGLSSVWPGMNREKEISKYTAIGAKTQTLVIFRFEFKGRSYPYRLKEIKGKNFSFSGKFLRYTNKGLSRMSIGIPNMSVN